eukprot:PhF_6_TR36161/c0_g1_i1/m.52599/K14806/DDX31, DBP7; ATP-dependent RNA helicase DDX31/DBP7
MDSFGLSSRLLQSLTAMNITSPTPIQTAAWDAMIQPTGDVVIHSATGSGKTLCYMLPLLHQIISGAATEPVQRGDGTVLLILVPARELALQVYQVCQQLVHYIPFLIPGIVVGGEQRSREKARLRKGNHILVATPGRLLDHIRTTSSFVIEKLKFLVFDEADRILDEGFERDIKELKAVLDKRCAFALSKRVLVSATMTKKVMELTHFMLKSPTVIRANQTDDAPPALLAATEKKPKTDKKKSAEDGGEDNGCAVEEEQGGDDDEAVAPIGGQYIFPETLTQQYIICSLKVRLVTLMALLSWASTTPSGTNTTEPPTTAPEEETKKNCKLIVFVNTADSVEFLYTVASRTCTPYANGAKKPPTNQPFIETNLFKLHGNMTQVDRTSIYNSFRESERGVLFCTDVAARGLDFPDIAMVIQYDPPVDEKCYVHRTGRTARIGRPGVSILFLMPHEVAVTNHFEAIGIHMEKRSPAVMLYQLIRLSGVDTDLWECAYKLQVAIQSLVSMNPEIKELAEKSFMSWRSGYSTYPKHLRQYFNAGELHLGFLARAFGIQSTPTGISRAVSQRKREERNAQREAEGIPQQTRHKSGPSGRPQGHHARETVLSEFHAGDFEGLDKPAKKRKS